MMGTGWVRSSINAAIFRRHSVVTHAPLPYTVSYDPTARVVLARRTPGTDRWTTLRTALTGDVAGAHNAMSLGIDGRGVLPRFWDQQGGPFAACRACGPAPRGFRTRCR